MMEEFIKKLRKRIEYDKFETETEAGFFEVILIDDLEDFIFGLEKEVKKK
jgi:hypothetical protein